MSSATVGSSEAPRSVYVHVPFCAHHCGYCNFTVTAGHDDLIGTYLEAVEREMSWLAQPQPVDTIFLGGGTPSHLPAEQLAQLLASVRKWFPPEGDYEWSVEANPNDLDDARAGLLAEYGVTRVSLGAQSFDPAKLKVLERDHSADEIARAVNRCIAMGIDVSVDLIFGAPGESLEVWHDDLSAALALAPQHISTYGLTYEKGAAFWGRRQRGELQQASEELERAMYLDGIDWLSSAGFEHYEVSNFALPGHACRHNDAYWDGRQYFAVGPGASRHIDNRRETNHRSTTAYLSRVLAGQSPVAESETLSAETKAREILVFGLCRLRGVSRRRFTDRTGMEIDSLVGEPLKRFVSLGLLEDAEGRVRLTREGLLVSDSLWPEFLG
jgi:oxygen-independent coproporphyrinogen-3 oxidase